jgi:hypothetical protein
MGSVPDHNILRWNDFQNQIAANLQDLRQAHEKFSLETLTLLTFNQDRYGTYRYLMSESKANYG